MKRQLPDGYELDDDPERIDVEVVCQFLIEESYWARGRAREDVIKTIRGATIVVGAYDEGGAMVGYCRAASDEVVFAYLCDVFVLDGHRGRGLGKELVREAVDNGPFSDLRWLLGTGDAHEMYREFGFREPSFLIMERPAITDE